MAKAVVSKQDLKEMGLYEKDVIFFENQRPVLRKKYPGRWVAVFNGRIVGVSRDFGLLLKDLQRKRISPGKTAIDFISTKEEIWILRTFR